jgi:hypothetical protein
MTDENVADENVAASDATIARVANVRDLVPGPKRVIDALLTRTTAPRLPSSLTSAVDPAHPQQL